jgi:hypothetical protein
MSKHGSSAAFGAGGGLDFSLPLPVSFLIIIAAGILGVAVCHRVIGDPSCSVPAAPHRAAAKTSVALGENKTAPDVRMNPDESLALRR